MNLHLHRVLSDLTGLSGMRILKAIVAGERDPQTLAALKHERVRKSEAEIAAALSGTYREEHLFVLSQELSLYETYQQHITDCDAQIETYLKHLPSPLPPHEQPQPKVVRKAVQNQPTFDLATHLHRQRKLKSLQKQAAALGFELSQTTQEETLTQDVLLGVRQLKSPFPSCFLTVELTLLPIRRYRF